MGRRFKSKFILFICLFINLTTLFQWAVSLRKQHNILESQNNKSINDDDFEFSLKEIDSKDIKDERFDKPIVSIDLKEAKSMKETQRCQVDIQKMVCFRK